MKFVTIFGTDPEKIAEPEPLKAPPAHIQIVDAKGNVVLSIDTQADHDEVVANMRERNDALIADHLKAHPTLMAVEGDGGDPPVIVEPVQFPIPDVQQSYQSILYRCKLDVEMHNGQFPDDPWSLQEEQDDSVLASPAVKE
jgi:hypothetical protein